MLSRMRASRNTVRTSRKHCCYEGCFRGGVDRDVEEKNGKSDPRVRRS
jgi:hypothetical protein